MSLEKYKNSKPANIQYSVTRRHVHPDFRLYVTQYRPQQADSIETKHLAGEKASEKSLEHYRQSQALLFHSIWSNFRPRANVSGNVQLYKLRRDGATYRLEQYGISQGRTTVEVSDARVSLDDRSVQFSSNNGNAVKLERTTFVYDTNRYTPATNPNPVPVWRLTVNQGNFQSIAYLVQLEM